MDELRQVTLILEHWDKTVYKSGKNEEFINQWIILG